jgi:hypothetical protein
MHIKNSKIGTTLETVTIKVDEELKRRMESVEENWSAYLRDAIRKRIEQEQRRKAAERLLTGLRNNPKKAPKGFINETIREARES